MSSVSTDHLPQLLSVSPALRTLPVLVLDCKRCCTHLARSPRSIDHTVPAWAERGFGRNRRGCRCVPIFSLRCSGHLIALSWTEVTPAWEAVSGQMTSWPNILTTTWEMAGTNPLLQECTLFSKVCSKTRQDVPNISCSGLKFPSVFQICQQEKVKP